MNAIKFLFKQLILALLFIGLFILGTLYFLDVWTHHAQTISVPDLSQKTLSQVDAILKEHKLRYEVSDSAVYYPNFPKYSVIKQSPEPNQNVKENRKIYLTINPSSYPKVSVPKVIQITHRNAVSIIRAVGLSVGEITYVDDIGKDMVLKIYHKGQEVFPGDLLVKTSVIDLECGNGNIPKPEQEIEENSEEITENQEETN